MRRRQFIACAIAAASPRILALSSEPLLLLRPEDKIGDHASILRRLADAALQRGPWNITGHRPAAAEVPLHEYYSEGPYWWPDPKNPAGPYIRKDGERNPDRFDDNHRDIGAMSAATLALGMAVHFLHEDRYAAHANRILNAWFLHPDTRMNPNLEYGQAVRGHNTGRGTGIIDTVGLIHAVQGILLLEHAGKLDKATSQGLRAWFAEYLHWMTASEKGLDEKKSGNNHATWWTAQVAAYATYLNDTRAQSMAWDHYREVLVPTQIRADGSCPREEARTRSLSYSVYNLDAFAVLCRIAQNAGLELWRFRAANGSSLETAIRYLTPYVEHPDRWRKQQIAPFDAAGIVYPGLAAVGLRSADLLRVYDELPRNLSAWTLLTGSIVASERAAVK